MKAEEDLQVTVLGAEVWPLSVEAYHTLGEARLIPERTELLYGFIHVLRQLTVSLANRRACRVMPCRFCGFPEAPLYFLF